jgi:hypothetical protein
MPHQKCNKANDYSVVDCTFRLAIRSITHPAAQSPKVAVTLAADP